MFQENTPDLFDNQRVSLAGVAAAHDELRFHGVDMGAGVLDHAIAPVRRLIIAVNGDDGMTRNPGSEFENFHVFTACHGLFVM